MAQTDWPWFSLLYAFRQSLQGSDTQFDHRSLKVPSAQSDISRDNQGFPFPHRGLSRS